jgi:two-component system chemotaxis sensor kinase CheA
VARKRKPATTEDKLAFDIEAGELEIFLQDVNEHLEAIEAGILRLEQSPELGEGQAADLATLNGVFRAAHTLKAVAATIGHQQMADLTHTLETLFDRMREGELVPTQVVTDGLLLAADALKALRDEVVNLQPSDVDVDTILARLRALMENTDDGGAAQAAGSPLAQRRLTEAEATQARDLYKDGYAILGIDIAAVGASVPAARLLQAAMALEQVGHIITQHPSQSDLLKENNEQDRMWLVLGTKADTDAIEQALVDIAELSEPRVQPYAIDTPAAAPPSSSQYPANATEQGNEKTVRINVEHLDTLMNLVGELVTDRTRLEQLESTMRVRYGRDESVAAVNELSTHFSRVVDQLQQEVMQARMLPIGRLFTKFPRLVRDVARAAGKQVNLIIEGEATELDRSVIEVIGDPLIHLLRNAVDHGIEQPGEREAVGKPATGTVWLTAGHEEGHIVVTVRDDGRGIDPARIRKAAVSRRLMSEEEVAQLDDDSAISLIFQPNLSTAEQVSDVSGRGVGLDVVRANVKRLSGSVVVESEVGVGTTFRLTLPLTLAILQTMLVSLGGDVYAIPLAGIVETLYLSDANVSSVKGKPVIRWRDSVLPLVHLRRFFARPGLDVAPPGKNGGAVVTVAWGRQQVGLIVDELIGKREIVIKSLSPIFGNVPGLSGCAILGDGRVGLIIDIPSLVNATVQLQRQGVSV